MLQENTPAVLIGPAWTIELNCQSHDFTHVTRTHHFIFNIQMTKYSETEWASHGSLLTQGNNTCYDFGFGGKILIVMKVSVLALRYYYMVIYFLPPSLMLGNAIKVSSLKRGPMKKVVPWARNVVTLVCFVVEILQFHQAIDLLSRAL